jgi:MOSC domain-containing protein YiiM
MNTAIGRIESVYCTDDAGSFVTAPRDVLDVTLDGIGGDRHGGLWRGAGPREPWLKRGFPIRNDRQLTILSVEEMADLAQRLALPEVPPELIGANLLVSGLPDLSRIAAGSRLAIGGSWAGQGHFDGQVLLRVEGYNHPCRGPGKKLALRFGRPELEFDFRKQATSLRGLILCVDAPGPIRPGDAVVIVPPPVAP